MSLLHIEDTYERTHIMLNRVLGNCPAGMTLSEIYEAVQKQGHTPEISIDEFNKLFDFTKASRTAVADGWLKLEDGRYMLATAGTAEPARDMTPKADEAPKGELAEMPAEPVAAAPAEEIPVTVENQPEAVIPTDELPKADEDSPKKKTKK